MSTCRCNVLEHTDVVPATTRERKQVQARVLQSVCKHEAAFLEAVQQWSEAVLGPAQMGRSVTHLLVHLLEEMRGTSEDGNLEEHGHGLIN